MNLVELFQAINQIRAMEGVEFIPKRLLPYRPKSAPACWGNCYPVTEALYHLWGKRLGYKPAYVRYKLRAKGLPVLRVTHWFLVNDYGNWMDGTAAQFDKLPDYRKGIRCGFLTKKPSKRARKIMRATLKAKAATA